MRVGVLHDMVHEVRSDETGAAGHEQPGHRLPRFQELEQVGTVPGFHQGFGAHAQFVVVEEALAPGHFFGHADLHAGAALHRSHVVGGIRHLVERPGVEPGGAAGQDLDLELAALEVFAVDVGDLVLAASAGSQVAGDLDHIVVVEVQPGTA